MNRTLCVYVRANGLLTEYANVEPFGRIFSPVDNQCQLPPWTPVKRAKASSSAGMVTCVSDPGDRPVYRVAWDSGFEPEACMSERVACWPSTRTVKLFRALNPFQGAYQRRVPHGDGTGFNGIPRISIQLSAGRGFFAPADLG